MPGRAPPVLEAGVALAVVGEGESHAAPRAPQLGGERPAILRAVLADQPKQLQRRRRRELEALAVVEPEELALEAQVDRHRAAEAGLERVPRHGRPAARAVHSLGSYPRYSSRSRCRAARWASVSVVSWWSSGSGWSQPMASGACAPTSNLRYWTDETRRLAHLPLVVAGVGLRAVGSLRVEVLREGEPLRELLGAGGGVVELDEQSAPDLAGAAEQLVVGLDLVDDVGFLDHPLGAGHLLDLVEDRLVVLEEEGEVRADVDAPLSLGLHGGVPDAVAALLVGDEVHDLAALHPLHDFSPSFFSAPFPTGVAKPSAR